jgi:deoxyribodipyrimidine photolyase-related protein
MATLLLFPNHLFEDVSLLKKYDTVFLIEEPLHFYDLVRRPFRFNKVKLAYLHACMQYYQALLTRTGIKVRYISYSEAGDVALQKALGKRACHCYDPHDRLVLDKYSALGIHLKVLPDSPLFIATDQELVDYHASLKNKQRNTNAHFYAYFKRKWGMLENVPSMDKENRRPVKDSPPAPQSETWDNEHYREAIAYVERLFPDNPGKVESVHAYPCTHALARKQLATFIQTKFEFFGPYQDAIAKDEVYLFHSGISAALNVGLLSPGDVVKMVMQHRDKIKLNSLEGFVRQIVGWRERCRYLYAFHYDALLSANHFGNTRSLRWDVWRNGKTGIPVLDNEITKARDTGYAHHIIRLMVFLNAMVLCRVRMADVVRWFMEICAIDAWDWVMLTNIASMGFYSDAFMTKPYVSTSNYLLKMSDYTKGEWCKEWDALFYAFLDDKKSKLKGGAAVYLRNLAAFEKKDSADRRRVLALADSVISRLTTK